MKQGTFMKYSKPAVRWEDGMPVGNGRLGAMVIGEPYHELMTLNEDSIWGGGPMNRINPDARKNLDKVRQFILDEKMNEAEELLKRDFTAIPPSMRQYQPLGELHIDMRSTGVFRVPKFHVDDYGRYSSRTNEQKEPDYTNYKRILDLGNSIQTVCYSQNDVHFTRKTIASYTDQVIAVELSANKPKSVSLSLSLSRDRHCDSIKKGPGNMLLMTGGDGNNGIKFCCGITVITKGGKTEVDGGYIIIDNADSVQLLLAAETSFYNGNKYISKTIERLSRAKEKGYASILADHIADYKMLYDRVSLTLAQKKEETTEESIKGVISDDENNLYLCSNELVVTYFNFGRYLLISSSRPGTQPANLQGIWNNKMDPKWDSKFTININTEMNYWPAEVCALPECHLPLFDLLKRMQKNGNYVAQEMYGCRGIVAHHNTDIWGDCAPQDLWMPATYWVMGAAWLSIHIWKHYEYTEDKEFLAEMYDIMQDAVLFFEDYLINYKGQYLTCPSTSPENSYVLDDGKIGTVTAGCSMDNEIMRELIKDYLKATELLDLASNVSAKAEEIIGKLPSLSVGKFGQIMEWREDYDEVEPGHRHISQLYALYPGNEITVENTPELALAAERTLDRRLKYGGGHTGWSCAWIIAYFASLNKGHKAYEYLCKLLKKSTTMSLLDTHPLQKQDIIFQIDGNLGATAAIMQMLFRAYDDRVILLPALPDEWCAGQLSGVVLPANVHMNLVWGNGTMVEASFCVGKSYSLEVISGSRSKRISLENNKWLRINHELETF